MNFIFRFRGLKFRILFTCHQTLEKLKILIKKYKFLKINLLKVILKKIDILSVNIFAELTSLFLLNSKYRFLS